MASPMTPRPSRYLSKVVMLFMKRCRLPHVSLARTSHWVVPPHVASQPPPLLLLNVKLQRAIDAANAVPGVVLFPQGEWGDRGSCDHGGAHCLPAGGCALPSQCCVPLISACPSFLLSPCRHLHPQAAHHHHPRARGPAGRRGEPLHLRCGQDGFCVCEAVAQSDLLAGRGRLGSPLRAFNHRCSKHQLVIPCCSLT